MRGCVGGLQGDAFAGSQYDHTGHSPSLVVFSPHHKHIMRLAWLDTDLQPQGVQPGHVRISRPEVCIELGQ